MEESTRPAIGRVEKRHRDQSLCSFCRRHKIKCRPKDRDWAEMQQRCEACQERNLVCGPNYRKRDDPWVREREARSQSSEDPFSEHPTPLGVITQTSLTGQRFDKCVNKSVEHSQGQQPHSEKKARDAGGFPSRSLDHSDGTLVEKATMKLERLNVLGTALNFASGYKPTSCAHALGSQDHPTAIKAIREKLHSLFIGAMRLGLQMAEQGQQYQARWILVELLLALEKYPGLYDDRKRGALLKIAAYFQSVNDHSQYEYVLEKVANMSDLMPAAEPKNDPCVLLAASYPGTSVRVEKVLGELWRKTFGLDEAPKDLALPPLQRALWFPNIAVAWALWQHLQGSQLRPDLFGQGGLHVAATRGMSEIAEALTRKSDIEARDSNKRTPLFLAASNGHALCCSVLLEAHASVGSRDDHGHTIAEVAAKGGYLDVLRHLQLRGADLNAAPLWCCSSPLQAAVEAIVPCVDLVQFLLDHGSISIDRRPSDLKSALDIAEERRLIEITQMLRHRTSTTFYMPGLDSSLFANCSFLPEKT